MSFAAAVSVWAYLWLFVYGVSTSPLKSSSIDGTPAKIGEFPWHATLYLQKNSSNGSSKDFRCSATIIHPKVLLTAAHCIYDESTRTAVAPGNLFVVTGNTHRDYNHPGQSTQLVRKSEVKNVYVHTNYHGLSGKFAADIALIELQQPFEFSKVLLPACLDVDGYTQEILVSGAYGKIATFGRITAKDAASSDILLSIAVPYISYSHCTERPKAAHDKVYIGVDKFCAGYADGSAICTGDFGSGLVFKRDDLWYVTGILSVGFGMDLDDKTTCDRDSYSLYTRVSTYMGWIQRTIFELEKHESYPSCSAAHKAFAKGRENF